MHRGLAAAPIEERNNAVNDVVVVANTEKIPKKDVRRLEESLAAAGFAKSKIVSVKRGSDAKAVALKAVKKGVDTVVVCGGDGTVRAAAEALVGTRAALAVVPRGTANLFASGLGLPDDIDEIVGLIVRRELRTIDTATCNGRTFCVMAGVGFDVRMLDGAEDGKERMGTLAYVASGVRAARQRTLFAASVKVDGEELFDGEASCVLVGNAGRLKAGIEAFPGASPTDGLVHVAVVTATGLRQWGGILAAAVVHQPEWSRNALLSEGKEITIEFEGKQQFELDGGVKTRAKSLDFKVRPRSLHVVAPAQEA